ncbi:MAG: hypothetical protein Q7U98_20370 [Methylicorpusculum sp.]|uniref:hypothetical protein n=1 Tax=Methylicorpusculum sp. TaxID=2713644 RepID=UPI0027276973|nr:hypothetical protein [Methylicorpusculum sp.]MDO8941521.1 hypothetical protein [Methylicorpusculum sp.]
MKTILIYVLSATLINAAALTGDLGLMLLSVLALIGLHQHTKTLTIKPMKNGFEKEM